jgi:hypothetical protein
VIPYVLSRLRPETREFGEQMGARFVDLGYESPGIGSSAAVGVAGDEWGLNVTCLPGGPKTTTVTTGYWDLLNLLWAGESDFIVVEHDVLPTAAMVEAMWTCSAEWCSGTHGRWAWERVCAQPEREVEYWPTQRDLKPCGQPHGLRCGYGPPDSEARFEACPLRHAGPLVLRNDSYLECVKFGSIRRRVPDLMGRVGRLQGTHQWDGLERLVLYVLADEEGLSPHLHFPATRHLRETEVTYDGGPWDAARYEADLAEQRSGLL